MSAEESFQTVKNFFETRQASRQAFSVLPEGVEIGVVIGETIECALMRKGDDPVVERRPAHDPDFIFYARPETVDVINSQTKDEISDIGIKIIGEIVAGNIRVKATSALFNVVRLSQRGYFEMIKKGGQPVMDYLSHRGLIGVMKIMNIVNRLKKLRRS